MENLSVHQRQTKQSSPTKKIKKPFKVVYISNPMKFIARADQFRAVVQELTGRDSNIGDTDDQRSKFPMIDQSDGQSVSDLTSYQTADQMEQQSNQAVDSYLYSDLDAMFEIFDAKLFVPRLENSSTLDYGPCFDANLGEV